MFHDQLEFCTSSTITLPHQQGYREACDQGKQSTRAAPFYHIAETFVCPLFSIRSSNYAKDALDLYFMPFCVIGPGSKQTQKDKYDEWKALEKGKLSYYEEVTKKFWCRKQVLKGEIADVELVYLMITE